MQFTGRILLHSIFRRKDMIIMINAALLATVLIGSWLWPPGFQASSSVVILSRTYPDLMTPPWGAGPSGLIMTPKEEINSEIEIIRSRPVIERVVKDLKLDEPRVTKEEGIAGSIRNVLRAVYLMMRDLSQSIGLSRKLTEQERFEAAVFRLQDRLIVDPQMDSQIIWIRYRSTDPQLAAQIVNRVAEEYQKQHLTININRAEGSFYAEQVEKLQSELRGLQEQLLKIKQSSGIVSFSEQMKSMLKKMETYDTAQTNVQKEIIRIRSKVEKISALRKARPGLLIPLPDFAQDPQLSDLENKLLNLKFQIRTVLQRYTSESRQVAVIREQIGHLEKQIREHVSTVLERELVKLRELQAEEQALGQTIKGMKEELGELPTTEMNIANLERDIDTKQGMLSVLLKKYQDSILAQSTDHRLENAKILSMAAPPLRPAFPNIPLNILLGAVFSIVFSFGLAFFMDYWDDSLKIPEDAERFLGRTVFASIPEF
jgi:uncharacterized protein involved in exopolysaccharide biosynthesis